MPEPVSLPRAVTVPPFIVIVSFLDLFALTIPEASFPTAVILPPVILIEPPKIPLL